MNGITKCPALLQSLYPYPSCTAAYPKNGSNYFALKIISCKNDSSMPDIQTLSVMPIDHQKEVLEIKIQSLYRIGIKDRLRDALDSCDIRGYENCSIELFLRRSEAVFTEFMLSMEQQIERVSSPSGVSKSEKRDIIKRDRITHNDRCSQYDRSQKQLLPSHYYYLALALQVDAIKWENVKFINDSLSCITFEVEDKRKRKHELTCELSSEFPSKAPICTTELPAKFDTGYWRYSSISNRNSIRQNASGLYNVFKEFCESIDFYQPLWDELDDLDEHCFVLEPSLPARRSIRERRIALHSTSGGLSVVLSLDSKRPRGVPVSMRFVGSTKQTSTNRDKFNQYIVGELSLDNQNSRLRWTENLSIRKNLERFLGELPSPANSEKSEFVLECGICYSNRLEEGGALPNACCGNKCCARSYHESCLFEWLHSLPSARISFDRIFGTCPYCLEPISVAIQKTSS